MKKFLKIFILMVFGLVALRAEAQENISPKGTTSCDGSGTVTPYCWNWNRINDGDYGSCGSQQAFIWTNTSGTGPTGNEWMQWDWSRSYLIGEIVIYHAQTTSRFLAGGTIQRWDGTKWVDYYKFTCSQSNCDNTVTFPPFVGDRLRITKFVSGTGQNSNFNYREIEIWAFASGLDAGVTKVSKPADACNYTQDIAVTFQNLGKTRLDSIEVHWTLDGVAQNPVYWNMGTNFNLSDTLTQGALKDVTLKTNHSFSESTDYDIVAWTSMPNGQTDTVPYTDTLKYTFEFAGTPTDPVTIDVRNCGIGEVELNAVANDSADRILWYKQRLGGVAIGEGSPITSPFLLRSDSFFAQATKMAKTGTTFDNGWKGTYIVTYSTNIEKGGYWDVTPGSGGILLDSLTIRLYQYIPGTNFRLYYKEGSFSGYETDASAWTLLKSGNGNLYTSSKGNLYTVKDLDMVLTGNKTYAFYFTVEPTAVHQDIWLEPGNPPTSNGTVTIQGGSVCQGLFGSVGVYTTYTQDVMLGYREIKCASNRVRLDVEIVPSPSGATLAKGNPFDGIFNNGKKVFPDYVAEERTVLYELTPPTKYDNTDFGTMWVVSDVSMGTVNGTPIPAGDTSMSPPDPSSGANGTLAYTPSLGWVDSTILLQITLYDYVENCDSVVTRYIYIAPTPRPNFRAGAICDGEPFELTNFTTIHKGFVNYLWDFDDGTTADFETPVHTWPGPGVYNVKLTVISDLGIDNDTTIQITVFEVPDVKFTVKNQCEGVAVIFLNGSTISTGNIDYTWTFGDGQSSNQENPTHLYNSPGGYKVKLVASSNGCSNELTKNAFQFARPDASFTVVGKCSGQPVTVKNTSTIANGNFGTLWDFGSGEYGTLPSDEYTFATGGVKTIKMIAISEFGCTDSAQQNVTIEQAPLADFSYGPLCDVDDVDFNNLTVEPTGIATIYEWNFGDGTTSTMKNPSHNYAQFGPVVITLKATGSNGCFTTKSVEDRVLIQPIAEFTTGGDGCSGEQIQFINRSTVSAGNIEYRWDFGDTDSSSQTSPKKVYSVNESTTFLATLTARVVGGCDDQYSLPVTIGEQPSCEFTATRSETDRTVWTFTPVNASYESYTWVFEGSGISTDVSPTHKFDYEESKYRIILRVRTIEGCDCQDSTNYITTSWGLGINENPAFSGIKVYPNPTGGVVFVEVDHWADGDNGVIRVLDITGREVKQISISAGKTSLDLSGLAGGMYTIKVLNTTTGSTASTNVRLQ